jgi:hypothetical protein
MPKRAPVRQRSTTKRTVGKRGVKTTRTTATATRRTIAKQSTAKRGTRRPVDALTAPLKGAVRHKLGNVVLDVGPAGAARVKRTIYPAGFRWSVDMKPVVGTDLCMHAHVGFLARGRLHIEYADGCTLEWKAPQIVVIDPGHEGWVVGDEPAVLIEFDFEGATIERLGMPPVHRHD